MTVVGCHRPPSTLLSRLYYDEIVLAGDLYWDWLKPVSNDFKSFCVSVNLTQLINGGQMAEQLGSRAIRRLPVRFPAVQKIALCPWARHFTLVASG